MNIVDTWVSVNTWYTTLTGWDKWQVEFALFIPVVAAFIFIDNATVSTIVGITYMVVWAINDYVFGEYF